jgi:isocitrate/isopropylmalate dehydrogenase
MTSCAVQEKNVELVDGSLITQRKYDRIIRKAFRDAERSANKAVKGVMTRKQVKEFFRETPVETEIIYE